MDFSLQISLIAAFLTAVWSMLYFNKYDATFRVASVYVLLSFLMDTAGYMMAKNYIETVSAFNYYQILDLWILAVIAVTISSKYKILILILASLCTAISLIAIGNNKSIYFVSIGLLTESIMVITLFLPVLISLFKKQNTQQNPVFWLALSFIAFYSTIIPFFGVLNYLSANNPYAAQKAYVIIDLLNIIKYMLLGYTFHLARKQTKKHTKLHG